MADNSVIRVLASGPDWVAVDKPANVLTHRGFGDPVRPMVQRVRDLMMRPVFPVHRLDRPTSGVLLFALSGAAAGALHRQFKEGRVKKRYLALVRGVPPEAGLIDHAVPDRWGNRKQEARTAFCRHVTDGRYSLLEVAPITGRRHQIRRHFKHVFCPLIGDVNYGDGRENRRFRSRHGLHRLVLHAFALSFDDPWRSDAPRVQIRSPLTEELARGLASWRADALAWLPLGAGPWAHLSPGATKDLVDAGRSTI